MRIEVGIQMVKVIKNETEYAAAMQRLDALMVASPASGSDDESELELLALVIEAYERATLPPIAPTPLDAIRLRMDAMQLRPKDLEPFIGARSKVSEVLAGKRPLSLEMIKRLHRGLGIPADVLLADSETVDLDELDSVEYDKFPLAEMLSMGCFPDFKGTIRELKEYAAEHVRNFLRSTTASPLLRRAALAQRGNKVADNLAMLAWRACVLKNARGQKLKAKFDREVMTEEWFRDLIQLSRFNDGPKLAAEFLAQSGIVLVIQKHFSRTFLDGAAMLDGEIPVVAITLRHDRMDHFWFVLIHELAHVKLHLTSELSLIEDDLESGSEGLAIEQEADAFASKMLIPADSWTSICAQLPLSLEGLFECARQLKIAPAILAGRIRHETKNYRLYSGVIGKKGQVSPFFIVNSAG